MAAALTTLSWLACLVALVPSLGIAMAIKFQEDREAKHALADVNIAEGASYLRRYRFLWASLPMSFLLLGLVAAAMFTCGPNSGCHSTHSSTSLFVLSLAVGLLAWSLTLSLLYNRYFHSAAERPFRALVGTERLMWLAARMLVPVTVAVAAAAVMQFG